MKNEILTADYPDLRQLEHHFSEHKDEYTQEYLRSRGMEDAKCSIPRPDSEEPSPFEQELLHDISRLASRVVSAYRHALEIVDAKIKAEEEFVDKKRLNAEQLSNDVLEIENDAAENSFSLAHAHKQLERSDGQYSEMVAKYGRNPIIYIPGWLYVIFALMIFLGEIPLNALVFQIFGENQVMTWVMAVIIGLSVPLTAHFVGLKMREQAEGLALGNTLKALGAFTIIVSALYGLSLMRQTYLGEYREQLGLTNTLVESSFMFFWLNIAVFCTAIVIAYMAHDPVPGFLEAHKENVSAAKAVEKKERERVKQLRKARMAKSKALDSANAQYRDGQIRVKMMKGMYDQLLKEGQEAEIRVLELLRKEIAVYRHENLKNRSDAAAPPAFSKQPDFTLKLAELREKLDNNGDAGSHG